jgi:hypothetical protein
MDRQLQYGKEGVDYKLNEWIFHCLELAEYYSDNIRYAQAGYLFNAALELLPLDIGKKKKMRAKILQEQGKLQI